MKVKISEKSLNKAFQKWSEKASLFLPSSSGYLQEYPGDFELDFNSVPVWGGIKEFVYPSRNIVAGEEKKEIRPLILFALRDCDMRALEGIFDVVFRQEEPRDPVYKAMRESLTFVSMDCFKPADTCFCSSVGGSPYGGKKADLNLSPVKGGYIAESFSDKGKELLEGLELQEVSEEDLSCYNDRKKEAESIVKSNFSLDYKKDSIGQKVSRNSDENYWKEKSETCMQCGGCNFSCPSCYCNVLSEMSGSKKVLKALQWDSCQFPGYARVAGGGTPRPHLWQSFRHRYFCKFTLMQGEFDMPGCTGCGRCIKTCPGKIDMRDTLEGLYG